MDEKKDRRNKENGVEVERRKGERRKKESKGEPVPLNRKADWDAIDEVLKDDKE